jgi:ribosomal protein S18 acetylase RimI-like enzyme
MTIKLSWVTADDIDGLVKLDKIAHKENKFWNIQSKAQFKKVVKRSKFLTIIAKNNQTPIGYLQSGLKNTKLHVWIDDIYVIKEFRKKGIAKMLVNKFVNHWKNKVNYIVLITEDKNIKIFEKLGFEKEMNYMGYKYSRGKRR